MGSKDARLRRAGQVLVRLEYENLMTALHLALDDQVSIRKFYGALSTYLGATKDGQRGLALGEAVRLRMQAYPEVALSGQLGAELICVLSHIGTQQLELKQYATAEASFQEERRLLDAQTTLGRETREQMKAEILHQLGRVAQEQRQWGQAEQYYQQALAIKIEFNDRYRQAHLYHNWGRMAQAQRQWEQAEQYYQQALAICGEFKDRYRQAGTYHQLGIVAQEQQQWGQARDYFLKDLAITAEFDDEHRLAITLRSLGRLCQASRDTDLLHAIASILRATPEDVETRLSSLLSAET